MIPVPAILLQMKRPQNGGYGMFSDRAVRGQPGSVEKRFLVDKWSVSEAAKHNVVKVLGG